MTKREHIIKGARRRDGRGVEYTASWDARRASVGAENKEKNMAKLELKGTVRSGGKKGASRKLRAAGSIPAVCYGRHVDTIAATIDPNDLAKILSTEFGPNIVFTLVLDDNGKEIRRDVMVKCVQREPVSRRILHADLYAIDADRKVNVRVPLRLDGKAVGVGLGGKLRAAARDVVISCLPKDIPTEVVVDISNLNIKERIQIGSVPRPAGCEFIFHSDFLVAEIYPPRS